MSEACFRCGRPADWGGGITPYVRHVCVTDEARGGWSSFDEQRLMRNLVRHGLQGWSQDDLAAAELLVQGWDAPGSWPPDDGDIEAFAESVKRFLQHGGLTE